MEYNSNSTDGTKNIAANFATSLKGGEVVALEGEIGAGKTTFVQGLAAALGADGLARSPTFTVMNVYQTTNERIKKIVHVDAYRLRAPDDLFNLGLEEWMGQSDSIVLIEWPRMVEEVEIKNERTVKISFGSSVDERVIEID